ncbi:YtxH domain-containing protein [Hymenobacter sp. BT186]|uniref:YtxH domain-containing protein n=1 Tax=Hymenobacter telluris TaxID=2816474 RepID=A0A939JEA5_9BACT|nr:YtxH domain-containing protein [Hymenobacter telluris]MBO0360250.1 YtxH domain-containing protein [Hymenobacter telluris]MBW3376277.1 YtxH domain-containing protein [Hymenobacter norwichensis]
MEDTKGKVIFSLLAGATIGAVAGLLLAPETGDETRAGLKKSASKLGKDLDKLFKDGISRFNSLTNQSPGTTKQQADRSAADVLLDALHSPENSADADSDYDGIGGDARHSAGYGKGI